MKRLFLFMVLATALRAQLVVTDPIHTTITSAIQAGQAANHLEILRRWAEQLERLNRQIRHLEEQLAVQRRIREVIGDPTAAGVGIVLRGLGLKDLARQYGETVQAARRLADAIESLKRRMDGIYRELDDRTVLGRTFARDGELYRRYAFVERQADNLEKVHGETAERASALQADLGATLEQLKGASTQAEVDKLSAKIAALNGQLAHVDAQRRDEADKLRAAQILNENQADKERQDLLERQLAEEKDTLHAVGAWQRGISLKPTSYAR